MNKIKFIIIFLGLLLTTSCAKYPIETSSGKEDVAYLLFVSQEGMYAKQDVSVSIDGKTTFTVQPVKEKRGKEKLKGSQYKVATGRRKVIVSNQNGDIIFSRELMLSTQDTKQILLP